MPPSIHYLQMSLGAVCAVILDTPLELFVAKSRRTHSGSPLRHPALQYCALVCMLKVYVHVHVFYSVVVHEYCG